MYYQFRLNSITLFIDSIVFVHKSLLALMSALLSIWKLKKDMYSVGDMFIHIMMALLS